VPGVGTPHDRPEEEYVFRGIATGEKPAPPGYSPEDFRIPTLEEALQRFPHELINVELKPDLDGEGNYEALIAEQLQRYGRFDDVIAASFVDEAANNFKAVAPCVHTSVPLDQGTVLVLGSQGDAPMPDVPEHVAFQVPPDTSQISQLPEGFFLEVVTPDFVADAHASNLAVQVWTVNECEEMLEMIALGVDAIMTDRPLLLEEILNTPAGERSCD
jgi:glycerophosphoryl diester phosphodiesterase